MYTPENSFDQDQFGRSSVAWLNPEVLRWARRWRGRSLEEAASRVTNKTAGDIEDWETGRSAPTVRQARILARYYDRPFLEFVLSRPPDVPEPLSVPDFRMHAGEEPQSEEWNLKDAVRWAEQQRVNAIDLFEELGEEPPQFPHELLASIGDSPEEKADQVRRYLNFPIEKQVGLPLSRAQEFPRLLRRLIEGVGVLSLKRTELAQIKVRGICIAEFPLPTIVVAKEAATAEAFTLMHEFAHVMIKRSAVSGAHSRHSISNPIENWCNRFAGAFLMPSSFVATVLGNAPALPASQILDERLEDVSKKLRVSPHAMLVRLVQLGYVDQEYYWEIKRPEFLQSENEKRGGGRPRYYGIRYRTRQGDLYTGLVLEALSSGRITNHNAAEFMGIKNLRHLEDIRDHFGNE